MRSMLFLVLALWLFSESTGYGKQGVLLSDVIDRRKERSALSSTASDGTASSKPTRHTLPMLSHDSTSEAKGIIPFDITDQIAANKQSLKLLLDRDAVCMLAHDKKMEGQRQTMSVVDNALDNKVKVAKKYVAVRRPLRGSNVPVSLHEKGWWGQSHTLLLDSVKLTSTDKQASSRQHLYIHTHSQDRHAIRMLSDPVSLEAEGHIAQLDIIASTPGDEQANAVRRQGVDSALLRYMGLTLAADLRMGVIDNVALPPTLSGIQAQATRLAPATFKQAGLIFNEFTLPTGASFDPTSAYVALVYRKISNFTVYTLPPQYKFMGPVVGIISSASNSISLNPSLPANISLSSNTFINIKLPMSSSNSIPNALCAFFASNGSIFISNLASLPNICVSFTLGDFALVRIVQSSSTSSPTQNPPSPVTTASPLTNVNGPSSSSTTSERTKNWKLVVGATSLTLAGLAFLVALALISIKLVDRYKLFFTSRFTGNEEALQNSLIGNNKAPVAAVMRTKPALEIDMAHFTN